MSDFSEAAFRPGEEFWVELDGDLYFFPVLSTAEDWLALLGNPDWASNVLRRCSSSTFTAMLDRVAEGDSPSATPLRLARAALADAAGRPWWEAQRLAAHALTPEILGAVLMRGVQPRALTLAAFLAVTETVIRNGLDDAKRMQFEMELTSPPPEALDEAPEEDPAAVIARLRGMTGARIG